LECTPADANPAEVARQIMRIVDMPCGKRPFRVPFDPSQNSAEFVNGVAGRGHIAGLYLPGAAVPDEHFIPTCRNGRTYETSIPLSLKGRKDDRDVTSEKCVEAPHSSLDDRYCRARRVAASC
jgi:hypothetical protein